MADSKVTIREVRFNFDDEQLTEVYVLVAPYSGDNPMQILGWHHKTFPARMSMLDIIQDKEFLEHLSWPLKAPDKIGGQ